MHHWLGFPPDFLGDTPRSSINILIQLIKILTHSSSCDQLAVTAIKFLTTVSTSVHHALFAAEGVILEICQSIVVPNVMLREEDEELFQMNYFEFIRRILTVVILTIGGEWHVRFS